MESRKLISFGNSSFVISVPKFWLNKHNLSKGDVVYFKENGENELIISSKLKEHKEELKKITIITNNKDLPRIRREIVSSYIAGYDILSINGNNLKENSRKIGEVLRELIALEVVDQTMDKIVVKDFSNIKEISINNLVRRMDIIIKSMLEDTKSSIKFDARKKSYIHERVYERDADINRLHFLVLRVIRKALQSPEILQSIDMKHSELLNIWILVSNLEKFADEIKRISRFLKHIELKDKNADEFIELYTKIEREYVNVMKAFYNNNKDLAYDIAARKSKIMEECNNYFDKVNIPVVGNIMEKFKGMEIYLVNIARAIYA